MSKVIASYAVKVTLREPDDLGEDQTVFDPPTNDLLSAAVKEAVEGFGSLVADGPRRPVVTATATRTDK